jgi:heme exporter protein A
VASEALEVQVRGLRARFGSSLVLRDVELSVDGGQRLAILGPNGAGKSTLLRVLAGALRPSSGELRLGGLDPARTPLEARARLGVLSHQTYLYGELSCWENLRLYGRLYGVSHLSERIGALLEQVGMYGRRDERVERLSRGLQQRLAMARAVLHDPPILLLDEPDTGLDLAAQQLLETVLFGPDPGRTVLMATHNLELARRLCDRAVVLVGGRVVLQLAAGELSAETLGGLYAQQQRRVAAR